MNIETAANPADEGLVTLTDPLDEVRNQPEQQEAQSNAGESEDIDALTREALGETEAKPEDEVEVEYEGEKRKLPPKWRDAFLRDQDYRRKTMDLAEQRKAFQTEREEISKIASQSREVFEARVEVASLDRTIADAQKIDTSGWAPEQINRARQMLQAMQARRDQIVATLQAAEQEQARVSSETIAKQREKALSEAAARIPNFTEQRRQELEELAVSTGVDEDLLKGGLISAAEYEILHYADIGKKFIERQRKAATMKAAQAGKPASTLGGGSAGGTSPEQMSPAEMAKFLGY